MSTAKYISTDEDNKGALEPSSLIESYKQFLKDPMNTLFINFRRYRAEQVKNWLSSRENVTVTSFDKEVWNLGYAMINGEKIDIFKLFAQGDEQKLAKFEDELAAGTIEYHGNSIWGSASRIYAPKIQDATLKSKYLQGMLDVLNNDAYTPVEKANQITGIPGFGDNSSTGLVMIFHPKEFTLWNNVSIKALTLLGRKVGRLEVFQESMMALKEELGAADFIELDWFLYKWYEEHNTETEVVQVEEESFENENIQDYKDVPWEHIRSYFSNSGIKLSERTLKRYHLSLKTRGFVVLSGISGTGKTWITQTYAKAVGAKFHLVPVSPNWTSNEDLLGYYNPIDNQYRHTEFSRFLEKASQEYVHSLELGISPAPYYVVLDEMNLARVEYYFAKFLSLMEVRSRGDEAWIELSPDSKLLLPPNLYVIGTVNVDETTHGFADKVYDRAQLIEIEFDRNDLYNHIDKGQYRNVIMDVWDAIHSVAPFAFRVVDEMVAYIKESEKLGYSWMESLDDQILQKVLPKIKGTDFAVGEALKALLEVLDPEFFPLCYKKANKMYEGYRNYGITSYF